MIMRREILMAKYTEVRDCGAANQSKSSLVFPAIDGSNYVPEYFMIGADVCLK